MAKTVEQIASDLNLSVTTVRLVLNGKAEQYRISVKTQTRINEYVERYGYVINHSARSLKLNKTDTLGLIVPNISNVFFATLAEKLEQRCRRSGYQLTISCTYDDAGKSPIWFLVGDTGLPSIGDRLQGYLNALNNNGILHSDWVREGPDNTPEGGYRLMDELIGEQGCPQAFIASSLPVLEGAINAIRNRFGTIPPEINIGTFDEHPMLGFLANNVWSMQQDENVWAEKAFDMMMSAIDDQPIKETVKVEMKLIKRVRQP